jgi:hypothetical protein
MMRNYAVFIEASRLSKEVEVAWPRYGIFRLGGTSVDTALRSFVQALRTANIKAYNERCHENEPVRILSFTPRAPFNAIDLIKALQCIRYNIDDQNVKGRAKRLEKLIIYLMERYIRDSAGW